MVEIVPIVSEKAIDQKSDCYLHGESHTPLIDAALRRPDAREHILSISEALVALASDETCTRCAANALSSALLSLTDGVKTAKHDRSWSKQEKKNFKAEMKELSRGLKKDMKLARKYERAERREKHACGRKLGKEKKMMTDDVKEVVNEKGTVGGDS